LPHADHSCQSHDISEIKDALKIIMQKINT